MRDDSEALNGEKTNLLQNSLSFLFFLQIDFLLNLPTLHPAQWFISILFWKANSDFCQPNILKTKKKRALKTFVLMVVGEQQTDKVATSSTLKVCCKRKGGREEVGGGSLQEIQDLVYPPSLALEHFFWIFQTN